MSADPLGLRDRAMLETLYSTGMRRSELTNLRAVDVHLAGGTIFVRLGKGGKDRVVPIGERACRWIERYIFEVRPELIDVDDDGTLFLAKHGQGMQAKQLSVIVRGAIERANLERFQGTHPNAACHLLRHACATHMLENGADIRYIQALLGHADLSTTEVYTRVSIQQLKAVHERTHPARMPGLGGARSHAADLDRRRRRQERSSGRLTAPLSLGAVHATDITPSRPLRKPRPAPVDALQRAAADQSQRASRRATRQATAGIEPAAAWQALRGKCAEAHFT